MDIAAVPVAAVFEPRSSEAGGCVCSSLPGSPVDSGCTALGRGSPEVLVGRTLPVPTGNDGPEDPVPFAKGGW